MKTLVRKIYAILTQHERRVFLGLGLLMIVNTGLEIVGLASLLPFMALIEDPTKIHSIGYVRFFYEALGQPEIKYFYLIIGIGLMFLMTFKYSFAFGSNFFQSQWLLKVQYRLEKILMGNYLNKNYEYYLAVNPAIIYQNVRSVSLITNSFFIPVLLLIGEVTTTVSMVGFMIWYKPKVTLMAILLVATIALFFWRSVKRKLVELGTSSYGDAVELTKWLNQSVLGIKDIKISNTQNFFIEKFLYHNKRFSLFRMRAQLLNQLGRPVLENLGVCFLLSYVLWHIYFFNEPAVLIPTLILLAGVAVRILPASNRVMGNLMMMRENQKLLSEVVDGILDGEDISPVSYSDHAANDLYLKNKIQFKNICFTYPGTEKLVLDHVSLEIKRGSFVGVVGESGSGKTTLIDILLGLFQNFSGEILIDDHKLVAASDSWQKWQHRIGYVPQNVYLYDGSIANNIAFGVPESEINVQQIQNAIEGAQLTKWISTLPEGIHTEVGDRGVRISGGQRQRLGIARALYRNAEVLVLDESTSALDPETEAEIIQSLLKIRGQKTVIMVTHRPSALVHCDGIFRLENGKIKLTETV